MSLRTFAGRSNDHVIMVNAHAHTTCSDGACTPEQVLAFADRHNIVISFTDHNTIEAHAKLHQHPDYRRLIIGGIEVQTRSGIELNVHGAWEQLAEMYGKVIHPTLDKDTPLFAPTSLRIRDLIEQSRNFGMQIIVPHFMLPLHGLGTLHPTKLARITRDLQDYREHVAVEFNPSVTVNDNVLALQYAQRHGFSVIASDDTHDGQFDASFTSIQRRPEDTRPIDQQVFDNLLMNQPKPEDMYIRQHTTLSMAQSGCKIAYQLWQKGGLPSFLFQRFIRSEADRHQDV